MLLPYGRVTFKRRKRFSPGAEATGTVSGTVTD